MYETKLHTPEVCSQAIITAAGLPLLMLIRSLCLECICCAIEMQVKWEDIGGMHELKQRLEQAIILPIRDPGLFERMGAKPPRGHLMYGPPGCSKTLIAKALATECDINFIAVQVCQLITVFNTT